MSYEDCQDVLRNWIEEYSRFALTGAFCVESKNEISKVGMAFIVEKDKHEEFEIGFRLRRVHWDKGYAKEITFGFINYSRNKINANSLIAEVYINNLKSRNVFEKLGFLKYKHPDGEKGIIYRYDLGMSSNEHN